MVSLSPSISLLRFFDPLLSLVLFCSLVPRLVLGLVWPCLWSASCPGLDEVWVWVLVLAGGERQAYRAGALPNLTPQTGGHSGPRLKL